MPDVYTTITHAQPGVVERVAAAMEARAADPQQRGFVRTFMDDLGLRSGATVLEVGCGTGAIARALAARRDVAAVLGVDPSPVLLAKARELAKGVSTLSFREGDARVLPIEDASVDAVVFYTVLCHIPDARQALSEAMRVLRPGGRLGIFDGDYATTTVAVGDHDPLQTCVMAFLEGFIHDPWLVRRLPGLVRSCGFSQPKFRSHGYVQIQEPSYMLSIVDRGADALVAAGHVGAATAEALKAEAARRAENGTFFGQISYASVIAEKPVDDLNVGSAST